MKLLTQIPVNSCIPSVMVVSGKPIVSGTLFFMSKNKMQSATIITGRSKKSAAIIGVRFGRLVVTNYLGKRLKSVLKSGKKIWASVVEAKCDCGSVRKYDTWNLTSGQAKSCGCVSDIIGSEKRVKHGQAREGKDTPEYLAWLSMKNRCNCPNTLGYKNYGGRGIKICERWSNSFDNFFEDMGKRPTPKHSLDRYPNTNGNYEPTNCRWATFKQQMNNTTRNRYLYLNGKKLSLTEYSEQNGLSYYETRKLYKQFNPTIKFNI